MASNRGDSGTEGPGQDWRALGDALLEQGRTGEATAAFREAVQLHPGDPAALIDLAHSAFQSGQRDEAVAWLARAVDREPGNVEARRSLLSMYRRAGRLEEALAVGMQILEARPDDVLTTLDVTDLGLALGRLDHAAAVLRTLRRIDDEPGHLVYAYHAMIEVEMRREDWRRALDLALESTRVDRYGRTTALLAFVAGRALGERDRPAPSRAAMAAALAASRGEHRRIHAEETLR